MLDLPEELNSITGIIIDTSIMIHKKIGPGLFESVYERILTKLLEEQGLKVEAQKPITFDFEGFHFDQGFRCDLMIENQVIVELKSVKELLPIHHKQLLTYLRLTDLQAGLLLNFNSNLMKDGIKRVINTYSLNN